MQIAIVDDLKSDQEMLADMITDVFAAEGVTIAGVACFISGEELLRGYYPGKFDMVFLDIYMGSMTGVETAQNIREKDGKVKIVFCTTSNEFASESYKLNAAYYLCKPVAKSDIQVMCRRILLSEIEAARHVILPDGQRLLLHNIIYSEYYNHLITIHTKAGKNVQIRMTQSGFAALFHDYPFIYPCCKGVLVNFHEVEKIEGDMIVMSDKTEIPISRRRLKEVNEAYADFLFTQLQNEMK